MDTTMDTKISPQFWGDRDVECLSSEEKLTVLWLLTNPGINMLGLCNATPMRFAFETGLKPEIRDAVLAKMPRMFARLGDWYFVRNFIRYQIGDGESLKRNTMFRVLQSQLNKLKPEVSSVVYEEYPVLVLTEEDKKPKPDQKLIAEIYEAYPRRVGRADALKAIERAIIKNGSPDKILEATKKFAATWNERREELQYCPHPATWFNQERFLDPIEHQVVRVNTTTANLRESLSAIEKLIASHPANHESIHFKIDRSAAEEYELDQLKLKRLEILKKIGGGK